MHEGSKRLTMPQDSLSKFFCHIFKVPKVLVIFEFSSLSNIYFDIMIPMDSKFYVTFIFIFT